MINSIRETIWIKNNSNKIIIEKDKEKYCINDFPDKKFVKLFTNALKLKDEEKLLKEYKKQPKE